MTCCEACRATLNIFIRKKCSACGQAHCTRCLTVVTPDIASARTSAMVRGRSRKVCVKCAMLISGDYSRDDLATRYTVRELRTFLISCKMTIAGCTEKADLIELAMKVSHAPNHRHSDDQEHASHVARLKEKMTELQQSDTADSSNDTVITGEDNSVSAAVSQHVDDATPAGVVDSGSANTENTADDPAAAAAAADDCDDANSSGSRDISGTQWSPADNNTDSQTPDNVSSTDEPAVATAADGDNDDNGDDVSSSLPTPASGPSSATASPFRQSAEHRRVKLSEISDVVSIESLTVRQLKELLANNFVDYKGCCEKPELVLRVRQLWTDHQRNIDYATAGSSSDSSGTFESHICKVCMDAVIDCLLLECGHMVTCTACGKRLSECPICRRYVVRVVRVFRA